MAQIYLDHAWTIAGKPVQFIVFNERPSQLTRTVLDCCWDTAFRCGGKLSSNTNIISATNFQDLRVWLRIPNLEVSSESPYSLRALLDKRSPWNATMFLSHLRFWIKCQNRPDRLFYPIMSHPCEWKQATRHSVIFRNRFEDAHHPHETNRHASDRPNVDDTRCAKGHTHNSLYFALRGHTGCACDDPVSLKSLASWQESCTYSSCPPIDVVINPSPTFVLWQEVWARIDALPRLCAH